MKNKWVVIIIMWIIYGTLSNVFPIFDHDLITLIPLLTTICLIFDFYPHINSAHKKEKLILKEISKTGSININEHIRLTLQGNTFQDIYVYYQNELICPLHAFKEKYEDQYKSFLTNLLEVKSQIKQVQEEVDFPFDEVIPKLESYHAQILDESITLGLYNCANQLKYLRKLLIEYPQNNSKINKLEQYYLPILLNILENYEKVSNTSKEHELKTKLNQTLVLVNEAIRNITHSLFEEDKLNLNVDMNVLENLLKKDGLVEEMSQSELKEAMEKVYE